MEGRRIPKEILASNPKIRRSVVLPEFGVRDWHTIQVTGTEDTWPNP
jgi:hypothetical protein